MRAIPIAPDATSGDVEAALAPLGAELLLTVVEDLAAGRALETPQDDRLATLAPKITKGEGEIDWRQPAPVIHNQVRGLQPWPLAATRFGGQRLVIRRTTVAPAPPADGAGPGSVLAARGDDLIVACGGGTALQILELQPEGKRVMRARDFLAARALGPDARFGA
jgi:methionyl-tRNA formyltransferase